MADVVERGEIKEVELKISVKRNGVGLEVDDEGNVKKMEELELPECTSVYYERDEDQGRTYLKFLSYNYMEPSEMRTGPNGEEDVWPCYDYFDPHDYIEDKSTKRERWEKEGKLIWAWEHVITTPYSGSHQLTRFVSKRWKAWWRKQVCDRYLDIACMEGRKSFIEARSNVEVDLAFLLMKNLKTKGAYYMIKRWKIPQETIHQRFVRLRYEELRTFEKFSLDWSFPKWCHCDKDMPDIVSYYNHYDYFAKRKLQTKSTIALNGSFNTSRWEKEASGRWILTGYRFNIPLVGSINDKFPLRCFPFPVVKGSSMPYSVEDKDGNPVTGDKQTWIHNGYRAVSANVALKAERGHKTKTA